MAGDKLDLEVTPDGIMLRSHCGRSDRGALTAAALSNLRHAQLCPGNDALQK